MEVVVFRVVCLAKADMLSESKLRHLIAGLEVGLDARVRVSR